MTGEASNSQQVSATDALKNNLAKTDPLSQKVIPVDDIFSNRQHLLNYYAIQAEDFRMRHTAIWTEIQHYTWVLSILLGAGPLAAVGQQNLDVLQLGLLLFLPLLGVFIAVLAYFIIRRDFLYYTQANSRLLYIEKQLGALTRSDYIDDRLARAQKSDFSVAQDAKEQNEAGLRALVKGKIRALILFSFILYAVAGVVEAAYFALFMFH